MGIAKKMLCTFIEKCDVPYCIPFNDDTVGIFNQLAIFLSLFASASSSCLRATAYRIFFESPANCDFASEASAIPKHPMMAPDNTASNTR